MRKLGLVLVVSASGLLVSTGGSSAPTLLGSSAMSWEEIQAAGKGRSRPVFRAPTATLDELECHVTQLAPGQSAHPPHKHVPEEIIIVREGTVEALVNGQNRRLGPGSVIFQASNVLHTIKNVGDVPASYHVIQWKSPGTVKTAEIKR
jgi:XRE family transcriptional regulator, regulator of sulfur utilization